MAGKWFVWNIMQKSIPRGYTMPEPIPDLSRDQNCHHYQAPSGQRCGSPALKGEYYCYHHHIKHATRNQHRVLIDPEITCMELPPIEDRASIFIALAAVAHRLAENTIDTRRAGLMVYTLQVAMQALPPLPVQPRQARPAAGSEPEPASCASDSNAAVQLATNNQQLATSPPKTVPITKESLLYFLRSRHCYNCNAELFPAAELTERRNPGAPPEVIEESRPALPAPKPSKRKTPAERLAQAAGTLPTLQAVAARPIGGVPYADSVTVSRSTGAASNDASSLRESSKTLPTTCRAGKLNLISGSANGHGVSRKCRGPIGTTCTSATPPSLRGSGCNRSARPSHATQVSKDRLSQACSNRKCSRIACSVFASAANDSSAAIAARNSP